MCGGQPGGQRAQPLFPLLPRVLQSRSFTVADLRSDRLYALGAGERSVSSCYINHLGHSQWREKPSKSHLPQNTTQRHQTHSDIQLLFDRKAFKTLTEKKKKIKLNKCWLLEKEKSYLCYFFSDKRFLQLIQSSISNLSRPVLTI